MKSSPERLRFDSPLREVRLSQPLSLEDAARRGREREQATYERGRKDGEKALSEQLLRQRGELLELQNGLFHSLRELLPRLVGEYEAGLVRLALEAVRKVVAGLPITVEMVEGAVHDALATVGTRDNLTVFLHAEDFALLQRVNSPLLLQDAAGKNLSLQVSPEATRGGCIVQTRFGTVDARRETKLRLVENSLAA